MIDQEIPTPWKLSPEELDRVEKGHRHLMQLQASDVKPIRLSLDPVNLRSQAEYIASGLIEQFGADGAEEFFAGAFRSAHTDLRRMSLQVGTTKNVKGKTYTLNDNHRWTVQKQQGLFGDSFEPESYSHKEFEELTGERPTNIKPTKERQTKMFDMKDGDLPGQTTMFDDDDDTDSPIDNYDKFLTDAGYKIGKGVGHDPRVGEGRYEITDPDGQTVKMPISKIKDLAESIKNGTKEHGEKVRERDDTRNTMHVDVEADARGDGVTDAARVGVPAWEVPPPPKQIPRIPNLTGKAREAETDFAEKYEKDFEQMTGDLLDVFHSQKREGMPIVFETDGAKDLSANWASESLNADLESRSKNRATLNIALHQTANAVTKRAFLKHLDTLPEGANVLVTVGGCGAGKGYALSQVKAAQELQSKASAVWDSAGDQNATENPWLMSECEKRGLTASFMFVNADPMNSWANPKFGVVQRATNPDNGRMVGARVFADSYAIGARNHNAFFQKNKNNPHAKFMFLSDGKEINGIPEESLNIDRKKLSDFAVKIIEEREGLPKHIKEGALMGQALWSD